MGSVFCGELRRLPPFHYRPLQIPLTSRGVQLWHHSRLREAEPRLLPIPSGLKRFPTAA